MLKLDARISKFLQHCSLFLKFQQNFRSFNKIFPCINAIRSTPNPKDRYGQY